MPTLESTPAEVFAYWGSLIGWDAPEPLDENAIPSHAHLLHEAFYGMAGNYFVASHLEWPLHRHLTTLDEPFAAYFELWRHGASSRFEPEGNVRMYVPNLVA